MLSRFMLGSVVVDAGDTLTPIGLNSRTVYCTDKRAYIDPMTGPWRPACLIDGNGDGSFERITVAPGAVWDGLTKALR